MKEYKFNATETTNHCIDWIKDYFVNNGDKDTTAVIGISGGKDSAVAAALCAKAIGKDRVIGIKMPEGVQDDINYANELIGHLGIKSYEVNIGKICNEAYSTLMYSGFSCMAEPRVTTNLPARIRMTILYAIAAEKHGRVVNTCNYSEDYIGYSTKFGDSAGDFAPLANLTSDEVIAIGKELDIPVTLLLKPPSDGLCGRTDEDNLGFSYDTLNKYLRKDIIPDYETLRNIETRHQINKHKIQRMPSFPYTTSSWDF